MRVTRAAVIAPQTTALPRNMLTSERILSSLVSMVSSLISVLCLKSKKRFLCSGQSLCTGDSYVDNYFSLCSYLGHTFNLVTVVN
jgi:hypothetical protein